MTSNSSNFAGILNRLAGEHDKRRKNASAGPRVGAAVFSSTTERQSQSIAAEVGKKILAAYRELTTPDVRKIENSDGNGAIAIDFDKLERLIRGTSSRQEILRLRRQIAMRYHPDVRSAAKRQEATATMAKNCMTICCWIKRITLSWLESQTQWYVTLY